MLSCRYKQLQHDELARRSKIAKKLEGKVTELQKQIKQLQLQIALHKYVSNLSNFSIYDLW